MIDGDIIDTCLRLMKLPLEKIIESTKFSTLYELLGVIWDCSDSSAEMGRAVISKHLHKGMIDCIKAPFFKVENMQESSNYSKISNFVNAIFSILYSTVRHNPESKQNFRDDGVIEVSLKYMQASKPVIKMLALLVVAHAADISANPELVRATSSNIFYILESFLAPAVSSRDRRSLIYQFSAQELLEALSLLSENSENATEMAKEGILPVCEKILEDKFSEEEIKPCLTIVLSMSLVEGLRDKIKAHRTFISLVEQCEDSENDMIKKLASGLLWSLKHLGKPKQCSDPEQPSEHKQSPEPKQFTEAKQPPKKGSTEPHIMISYSWKRRVVPRYIYQELTTAGKKVWIDVNHMKGNMSATMAAAVRSSSHFICFISEEYAASPYCKQEAEFAFASNKEMIFVKVQPNYEPPDWLDCKIKGRLYYEMYNEEEAENKFARLLADMDGTQFEKHIREEKN